MTTRTATASQIRNPPPYNQAFVAIDAELFAASTTLSAITGLMEMLARRDFITPSPETVEYLLEAMDTLAVHVAQAIVLYGEASRLAPVEMHSLRTALDLGTEQKGDPMRGFTWSGWQDDKMK